MNGKTTEEFEQKNDGLCFKNLFCFSHVILILLSPPLIWNNCNSHMQAKSSPLLRKEKMKIKAKNKNKNFQQEQ